MGRERDNNRYHQEERCHRQEVVGGGSQVCFPKTRSWWGGSCVCFTKSVFLRKKVVGEVPKCVFLRVCFPQGRAMPLVFLNLKKTQEYRSMSPRVFLNLRITLENFCVPKNGFSFSFPSRNTGTPKNRTIFTWHTPWGSSLGGDPIQKPGVCDTCGLAIYIKKYLMQKKNYENSNISPCKNIIFKNPLKEIENLQGIITLLVWPVPLAQVLA